ncbi:MAG: GAF domain-containing protein [Chloroflexi bacterium]|nr:GAF domain-containing protein [Chloroflexota bacterium]
MHKRSKISPALRAALLYAAAGGVWILVSDWAAAALAKETASLLSLQTYKGLLFVLGTALVLFLLLAIEQREIRKAEKNFEDLFEAATEGVFRSSPQGRYLAVNPAMAKLYGYDSPQEMMEQVVDIGKQVHLSAESRRRFMEALAQNGAVENFEAKNRKKDGSVIWTSTNARAVRDKAGNIIYYEGFITDVTKQKNAEQALKEAEKSYRMLVENLPAVVFMDRFNDEQETVYVSPRIYDLLGYTPEEWKADKEIWEKSLHPGDRERVLAEDSRTNQSCEPFRVEYRLRHRDGHYVWIKEDASPIRGEDGVPLFWQGILLDISEQKRAEEDLRRSDNILKAVGFSAEQFLKSSNWRKCLPLILETLGKATNVSRAYVFQKSFSPENVVLVTQIAEWNAEGVKPQIENPKLQNKDAEGFSRWIERFDKGLPIHGLVRDFPQEERDFLEAQDIVSLVCIPIEVGKDWWGFIGLDECAQERIWSEGELEALKAAANTLGAAIEKKAAEEALQNSEASYRRLFNSIQDAIYIQDRQGVFLDVNDGAARMYGYPKEEFIGKTPDFLSAPGKNDVEGVKKAVQRAFQGEAQRFEFWGRRSNGEIFPKDVQLSKGVYFGQDAVIAIAQDITERKRIEEETQRHLRELTVLHAAALAESTASSIDELLEGVTNIISDTLYPDACGFLLLNEKGDMLKPHFSYRGTSAEDLNLWMPLTIGITGRVAASGSSFRSGDVSREEAYFEAAAGIRSELCIPLKNGEKIIGVLNVESRQPNAFTRTDERLLNTIAGGMAKSIERIQLFELEQKRRSQAEILREATGQLTALFDRQKLFETLFDLLAKLIGYDSASIETLKDGYFEIAAGKNIPQTLIGKRYKPNLEKWGGFAELRQPIIIPDVQQDDRFEVFEETNYIRGWMAIPMFAGENLIGFLNLDSRTVGFFTQEHAAIAQTFANQAAIALENARLFELERHRRAQAEILSQATTALANTLDSKRLFEDILDWLEKIAPYDSASITLSDGNFQRLAAQRGLPSSYVIGEKFPIKPNDKWNLVIASRKPLILEDAQNSELFEKWKDSEYIRGWMCAAVFAQDKLTGFINVDNRTPGAFNEEQAVLLQTFANQAAIAIENARLFELEQKRRRNAEIVRQAATILNTLLELPALYEAILDWLYKITPYDSATIFELEGSAARISACRGLPHPEKALAQTFPADNALCQILNETREPLILEDCEKDPRFEGWGDVKGMHGWMGVPLISRGQVIGYITLDSRTAGAFTQNDAVACQTFAHQAATALENSRLFTETRQRLEELESVSRVSFALRAAQNVDEMLPILLEEIKFSVGAESAAIWLYELDSNVLQAKAVSGRFNRLRKTDFQPGEGVVGRVYLLGEPYLTEGKSSRSDVHEENHEVFGENWSGLVVPLRTVNETIGALAVALENGSEIKPHHVRLMSTLAEIAGNAIHRSNLYQKSEEQIQRLMTLRELDAAISSNLDLRLTLGILTEHLLARMGVSAAAVLTFNPASQTLEYSAIAGFKNPAKTLRSIKLGDPLAGRILLNRRAYYIKDLEAEDSPPLRSPLEMEGFKSYYAAPLFSKGATKGILETYFRQPFSPSADWVEFIHMLAEQAVIAIDNAELFENLERTSQELSLAYDRTLEGWGKALELRDKETQGHTQRVTDLTLELARQMGIAEDELAQIRRGVLLHDIGKMGVPDRILRKKGRLTADEQAEMRKHPQYAYDMIYPIEYLRPALDIAYCHHEWWDGSGYPRGLKGAEIPLSARIFAVVDVWDALSSDRPYRKAWKRGKIIEYIRSLSGRQFDPQVVNAFFRMIEEKEN